MKMDRASTMMALSRGQAVFNGDDFSKEDLSGLRFIKSWFLRCSFDGACLDDTGFLETLVDECSFEEVLLTPLCGARFDHCDIARSSFRKSGWGETSFTACNMGGVDFGYSDIWKTTFKGSELANLALRDHGVVSSLVAWDPQKTFEGAHIYSHTPKSAVPYRGSAPTTAPAGVITPPFEVDLPNTLSPQLDKQTLKSLNMDITRRTCAKCGGPLRGCPGFTYCGVCECEK